MSYGELRYFCDKCGFYYYTTSMSDYKIMNMAEMCLPCLERDREEAYATTDTNYNTAN